MSPTIAPPVRPVRTASRSGTPGPDNATSPDRSGSRRLPDLAVALFAGVWLTSSWERIGAPLGFSHDGQNAGVFGSAARRLVDDPFGSHLGSRLANGHGVYSNHPPLLNWLLGIGHSVTGDDPAGLRVPMVVAALVLIAATYRLLRLLVSSPWAAAVGTMAGLGVPMFFVYGTMPDTPMLGLPLGVLLLGQVVAAETTPPKRSWLIVATAAGCALAGWEAVFFAGIIATVALVRGRRGERASTASGRAVFTGLAIGGAVTLAWIAWADGGLTRLADQFLFRSGAADVPFTVGEAAVAQIQYLADVYGVVLLLAMFAALPALRVPAVRRHLPTVVGVCLVYHVGFWQGATYHDYWSYWWQLPMAMCFAGAIEAIALSTTTQRRHVAAVAAVVLVAAGPLWTLAGRSQAERDYRRGLEVAALLESIERPPDQDHVLMFGIGLPVAWASWSTDEPVDRLNLAQLREVATIHPDWMVIAHCEVELPDRGPGLCDRLPGWAPRAGDVVVTDPVQLAAVID